MQGPAMAPLQQPCCQIADDWCVGPLPYLHCKARCQKFIERYPMYLVGAAEDLQGAPGIEAFQHCTECCSNIKLSPWAWVHQERKKPAFLHDQMLPVSAYPSRALQKSGSAAGSAAASAVSAATHLKPSTLRKETGEKAAGAGDSNTGVRPSP